MSLTVTCRQLDDTISELYDGHLKRVCQVLIESVVDSSKRPTDFLLNDLAVPKMKLREKHLLYVFSWWMPEEIRYILQLKLEETWGGDSREILEVSKISKEHCLGVLLVSEGWNDRDFFGNFLNVKTLVRILNRIYIKKRPTFVRRKVRRRGYNDHGSRRPSHNPEPVFTGKLRTVSEQLLLEAERELAILLLLERVEERLAS